MNGDPAMKAGLLVAFLAVASFNSEAAETGPARGSAYTIIRFNTVTGDYDRAAMDRQKFDESMGGAANTANPLAHGAPSSTLV
jgi:hypothetical protein